MTVYMIVVPVTYRALLLFPSHLCDFQFHHLHASLVYSSSNALILSSCNHYVRRSDLKLDTVTALICILFSL
jgi:hypothetical protein